MARRALQVHVRAGQKEAGGRMIERSAQPRRRVVTLCARLREPDLRVIRFRGSAVILLMTTDAVARGALVLPVEMASAAIE